MSRSFSGKKVILGGGNNIHEKVMASWKNMAYLRNMAGMCNVQVYLTVLVLGDNTINRIHMVSSDWNAKPGLCGSFRMLCISTLQAGLGTWWIFFWWNIRLRVAGSLIWEKNLSNPLRTIFIHQAFIQQICTEAAVLRATREI